VIETYLKLNSEKSLCSRLSSVCIAVLFSLCADIPVGQAQDQQSFCDKSQCDLDKLGVLDHHEFAGLAIYLNGVRAYLVDQDEVIEVESEAEVQLKRDSWFVVVGRFNALAIQAPGTALRLSGSLLRIAESDTPSSQFSIVEKRQLASIAPELDQLRYHQLWWPFAKLAIATEFILTNIQSHIIGSWGWSIVAFSLLFKLIMLPVTNMTTRLQLRVSEIKNSLEPKLRHIKQKYDGEEAHNKIMEAHKDLGVSPFYSLKPMLGTAIQIPILIAVFNALGEMPQLDMQTFLWVDNLAYPDAITTLPITIPGLGATLNLMPIAMTIVTVFSATTFTNVFASDIELKKQKRNLYLMAVVFFALFYPFPAAMVLFWTSNNLVQMVQPLLSRKCHQKTLVSS
jgi:YidC/Oxa1 family membrane protein insertase